jgi:hypothetical protein
MEKLQVILSKKGRRMICFQGFMFWHHKDGLRKKIWRCQEHQTRKCKARLHTTDTMKNIKVIQAKGSHNHEPHPILNEVKRALNQIRMEASVLTSHPSQLIADNVLNVTLAAKGALPRLDSIKRSIRNIRTATLRHLIAPRSRAEIDIPEKLRTTLGSNPVSFLLFDSITTHLTQERIFGTRENLHFLKLSDIWLVDGTFKCSPTLFYQIFVIHAYRTNSIFPLVYCLTPNRTTETYSRIIAALKDLEPSLTPKIIMSDFEIASRNAFHAAFPEAEQKGCFFHFTQSLYRNIQRYHEIHDKYSNDSDFALMLRHLCALAFVPAHDVDAIFEALMDEEFFSKNEAILTEYIIYFENTWLGRWNRRHTRRIPPKFEISQWNCYNSVLEDLPRTNNGCEGFHHALASLLGCSHPTIFKLIEGLQRQQQLTEIKIQQFIANSNAPVKKRYAKKNQNLKDIVSGYGSQNFCPIEYLRRLAYYLIK